MILLVFLIFRFQSKNVIDSEGHSILNIKCGWSIVDNVGGTGILLLVILFELRICQHSTLKKISPLLSMRREREGGSNRYFKSKINIFCTFLIYFKY
jgi:hypothetical protein